MDCRASKVTAIASHRFSQIVDESIANTLFELSRSNIIVEIENFLMQTKQGSVLTFSAMIYRGLMTYRNAISEVAEWSTVAQGHGSSSGFGWNMGISNPLAGFMLAFFNCP